MPRQFGSNGTPSYRKHAPSGQAVVTLCGRDFYLGHYATKASRDEYDRRVAEWLAAGRQLVGGHDLSILELTRDFWRHVKKYYANPGGSDGEIVSNKLALAIVARLYGQTEAKAFGPMALKTVRQAMVNAGWCRTYVNSQVGRVRHMFKWAVEHEKVPAETWHALQAVSGLRVGKTDARESKPVRPVAMQHVDAVLPFVSPQVKAMIQLQTLTGMRPGEVCIMRRSDIDMADSLWAYRPARHKTQSRGHDRVIYLGARCREIIAPFLKPELEAYLFSPADADEWTRKLRSTARKTPESCGNRPGTHRVRSPKRRPRDHYRVISYGLAIKRACDRAFPPPQELSRLRVKGNKKDALRWETDAEWKHRLGVQKWAELIRWRADHAWHPHQIRHSAATRLREEHGLEAAQVILGHKTLSVTQVYAEKNVKAAQRIMGLVG